MLLCSKKCHSFKESIERAQETFTHLGCDLGLGCKCRFRSNPFCQVLCSLGQVIQLLRALISSTGKKSQMDSCKIDKYMGQS